MIPVPEVLRVREFRDVWLASLASNAGSWLQIVASGWLILKATDSPAAVGALALVTRAPAILLAGYAGQIADRFDRRLVGIWTFLLQGVAAGLLAVDHLGRRRQRAGDLRPHLRGGRGVRPRPAGDAGPDPGPGAAAAALAGGQPQRGRHQRGPPAGAGDRRRHARALRRDGLLRGQRALVPRAGVGAHAAGAAPAGALRAATATGCARPSRTPGATPRCAACCSGMALFTALASPIQELAPVVADRLDAGAGGLGLLLGAMGGGALVGAWLLERLQSAGLHAPPRPAHRHPHLLGGPRGGRADPVVRARHPRDGLQRRLLDLDVRGHQHRDPAAGARAPAGAAARALPALGHRTDRGRVDPGRAGGRAGRHRGDAHRAARCCWRRGERGACATTCRPSTRRPRPPPPQSAKAATASRARAGTRPSTCRKCPAPGTVRVVVRRPRSRGPPGSRPMSVIGTVRSRVPCTSRTGWRSAAASGRGSRPSVARADVRRRSAASAGGRPCPRPAGAGRGAARGPTGSRPAWPGRCAPPGAPGRRPGCGRSGSPGGCRPPGRRDQAPGGGDGVGRERPGVEPGQGRPLRSGRCRACRSAAP